MFFTVEKIEQQLKEIRSAVHREACDISWFKYQESAWGEDPEGAECPEFDDRAWANFHVGDSWGGYDRVAWFRTWLAIPDYFKDKKLALRFQVGPRDGSGSTAETLLYINGTPLQGIDVWHEEAWLPPEMLSKGEILIALKAWSGVLDVPERRRFKTAQLLWIDEPAEKFYYRCDPLLKAAKALGEDDLRRVRLVEVLNRAIHQVDFLKPGSQAFYDSIALAEDTLQEQISALQEVEEIKPKVIGIGHAHIDLAWLWRLRHSREKAARTFTTALHLMRQYPEYHFLHSSPQLYKFLKQDHPEIYSRLKDEIASGRWEVTGGMWIEADTNIPSGESLIRQILLGKRFVRDEFGVEMHTLWLPDVFGYSWALPQIVRKSGLKYFLTTKISWSQFNRFPYDTFNWRGIDGTDLLTHFVTTPDSYAWFYTYNGQLQPGEVKGLWDNYRQKDLNNELLSIYGWGDGGGGPTREMLDSARALKNLPGLPKVELGSAEAYFDRLEQRLKDCDVPVWDGELYLEYHRGTYTSQAANKRFNRKAEILYHDAEWLSAMADILNGQANYPSPALQEGWESILLNQFHDILPGSSIHPVYEDSREDYERVFRIGERIAGEAQAAILRQIPSEQGGIAVFNPLSWRRDGVIELPWSEQLADKTILNADGRRSPVQTCGTGKRKSILLEARDIPALGYQTLPLVSRPEPEARQENDLVISPSCLENRYYRIELNSKGQITSLWDKRQTRQVLAPGARANVIQAFEDKPMGNDAWDIDIYYQEKVREVDRLTEAIVEETGPVRGTLRLRWDFYDSTITQRICLYRSSPRIDFNTEVDWHEHQVLLKVAFPVNIRATHATYDIQFGNIDRPTHWNTSWDYARFEAVGHKWVDLSEGDYGVSLLNDCKYGYDVKNNVLRLTLLKSAIHPDAMADQGQHLFTYSLLPHAGDWRSSKVVEEAYDLNDPLLVGQVPAGSSGSLGSSYQFAEIDAANVILETVKKAEQGEAWVVRVYEFKQCRSSAVSIRFGQAIQKAVECNLVEEGEQPVSYQNEVLKFPISPYEIKTFKVWF